MENFDDNIFQNLEKNNLDSNSNILLDKNKCEEGNNKLLEKNDNIDKILESKKFGFASKISQIIE